MKNTITVSIMKGHLPKINNNTKSLKQISFIGMVFIFILTSCTMEKRVYMSGYNIEWNKHKNSIEREVITKRTNEKQKEQIQNVIAEKENDTLFNAPITIDNNLTASLSKAFVIPSKKPISVIKKENVAIINYHKASEIKSVITKKEKKTEKTNFVGGGKSQIVALILCILLGYLGIHRFYLGYSGLGLLYLFTLGLFGIGWILDILLLIIPNGLTPKGKTSYRE